MKRILLGSLLAALILATGACNYAGAPDGSALIEWRIRGNTCQGADLAEVEVELWERDELVDVTVERCAVGKTTFHGLPPGRYDVQLWAYPPPVEGGAAERSRDDATFEGFYEELAVRSNQLASLASPVSLTARKGAVYVSWRFVNGMMCLQNGVRDVELGIFDEYGDEVAGGVYDCSLERYVASLPPERINDASRGVYFSGLNVAPLAIEALGLNVDGRPIYKATSDFQLDYGEQRDVVLSLEPCSDSCI